MLEHLSSPARWRWEGGWTAERHQPAWLNSALGFKPKTEEKSLGRPCSALPSGKEQQPGPALLHFLTQVIRKTISIIILTETHPRGIQIYLQFLGDFFFQLFRNKILKDKAPAKCFCFCSVFLLSNKLPATRTKCSGVQPGVPTPVNTANGTCRQLRARQNLPDLQPRNAGRAPAPPGTAPLL